MKRNQEFKRRHFQGQMLRSALDMPNGGVQEDKGMELPFGQVDARQDPRTEQQ